jgi:hypothetical protein
MLARALVASAVISRGERPRARRPAQQQQRSWALGGAPRPSGQQQQAGEWCAAWTNVKRAAGSAPPCLRPPVGVKVAARARSRRAGRATPRHLPLVAAAAGRQAGRRRRRWPAGSAQGSQPARLPSIPHPLTHSSLILCPWRQQQQQQLVRATARPSGRPAASSRAARPSSDRRRTTARAESETAWSCSVCLAHPGIPP